MDDAGVLKAHIVHVPRIRPRICVRILLRRIRRAEKNGQLANPELYICLGAYTKENYFDGRKVLDDVTDGRTYMKAHEYYNLLKKRAIARIRSRYDGDNKPENTSDASDPQCGV